MTKDPDKIESLFSNLPQSIKIIGKQVTRSYKVKWQKEGTEDFNGSRFIFILNTEDSEENT